MKCFLCQKKLEETYSEGNEQPDDGVCVTVYGYYGSKFDIASDITGDYYAGFMCDDCMEKSVAHMEKRNNPKDDRRLKPEEIRKLLEEGKIG